MTDRKEDGTSKDGRVARGEITRERVLDAAERCFAELGFDAVSIRRIAREAEVTLGVVGFHGGTKQQLFVTVLKRRVETLNAMRMARLDALKSTERLTLETLIDAYVTPYLEIASRGDPQWRAYAQLVARIMSDERYYREAGPLYDRVASLYLDEMARLRPDADREQLAAVLSLTVSSMVSIVASGIRIAGLSQSDRRESPMVYRPLLLDFCVGGVLRALEPKC